MLALFFNLLRDLYRSRAFKVDLLGVTVLIDGGIHLGVIDLNDPSGLLLKRLYTAHPAVSMVVLTPFLSGPSYTGICVIQPTNIHYRTIARGDLGTHIITQFPSPVINVWHLMENYLGLEVYTGYEECAVRIYPPRHTNLIEVRGIEEDFLTALRPEQFL
jgi:hypothetical protein